MDVSMVEFKHVKMDGDPVTETEQKSGLNRCLTLEANIDQSYIDFMQDIVMSMMDEGVVAVVPVDTRISPEDDCMAVDILTMRTGKIVQWYPEAVRVLVYNDKTGQEEEIIARKENVAIIENPLYTVVNADNSTLKRLVRKLQLMDIVDEGIASNKLDIILQLPYVVKGDIRKKQAEERIASIQSQLTNSKYGIAYIDGTEHITQLNRAVENNLLKEIEYLSNELFNQLGMTSRIFDGTASEQELRSYFDRIVNPIAKRITLELNRKFLSDTARTQGHAIVYYSNPFKLVPISTLASVSDTLRRNEILTTNEIRGIMGFQPSDDPKANQLSNPNIADVNQDPSISNRQVKKDLQEAQQGSTEEEGDTNE